MEIEYLCGNDHRAYYCKWHVSHDEFKIALMREVDNDDTILNQEICHTYMRKCRDFHGDCNFIMVESKPGHGAFPVTWIQEY